LGAGGMGEVWRARHRMLARTAAIKLIRPTLAGNASAGMSDQARQRFEREAQSIARLRSPHTVDVFDYGIADDGAFYYAMELLEGLDADALVRRFGPIPSERAVFVLRQVCHSLSEAESCGLVHRDIKPSNVFLCRYGEDYDFVKVLDFGIVKSSHDGPGAQTALTGENVIHGTPAFMAPEQAIDTHRADERADIYSLGCTLYFLLTGKAPYEAKSTVEGLLAHRERPIPSLRAVRPDCPAAVDDLFRRMLAKKPADRPASMKAVIAELASPRPVVRRNAHWPGLIAASVAFIAFGLAAFALWSANGNVGEQKKDDKIATPPKKDAKPVMEMARIEPGDFWMGASDSDTRAKAAEKPRRKIRINKAFFLGKTEVIQARSARRAHSKRASRTSTRASIPSNR